MQKGRRVVRSLRLVRWLGVIVVLGIAVGYVQPIRSYFHAKDDLAAKREQRTALLHKQAALHHRIELVGTEDFIVREARRIGLVNRGVPADQLDDATMALAEEIAKNEPFVIQTTKRAANRAWDVAGFRAAMAANTELDVMIETANLPARDEFRRITQEKGLKAAIAWRDRRFRGDA